MLTPLHSVIDIGEYDLLAPIWKYRKSTSDSTCSQDGLVTVKRLKGDYVTFSVLYNILQNVLSKRIAC